MIWTNIIQIGWQVVPGIKHLFVENYTEMCLNNSLEMKELTDIISCVLLMHTKNNPPEHDDISSGGGYTLP